MSRMKGRTTAGLRENARAGAEREEEEGPSGRGSRGGSRSALAVNSRPPDRLPSPNLCPDGSAERKSFAPQKSRIKDMPINVLFPPFPPAEPHLHPAFRLLVDVELLVFSHPISLESAPFNPLQRRSGRGSFCSFVPGTGGAAGRCGETGETRDNARRADNLRDGIRQMASLKSAVTCGGLSR